MYYIITIIKNKANFYLHKKLMVSSSVMSQRTVIGIFPLKWEGNCSLMIVKHYKINVFLTKLNVLQTRQNNK